LLDISITPDEKFSKNFEKNTVELGIKYKLTIEIKGFLGKPYAVYFGVVFLNENNSEVSRVINWLNDFSGKQYSKSLIFSPPKESKKMIPILRANIETPVKTNIHLQVDGLEKSLTHVDITTPDDFVFTNDFLIPFQKELTKEEEDQLEKNLVWIIGPPRSGTSWFGTKLLSYDTLSMNEPQIGLHLGIRQPRIKKQMVRHIDLFEKEPDYFFSKQYSETWRYYLRKLIINRIYSQFQNLTQKIIIKEPNGSMGIDIITQCLTNSKIIFLIRDGRDTTDSKLDSLKKKSWAIKNYGYTPLNPNHRLEEIKFQCKLWVKLMDVLENAFEQHPKENKIKLKYENLRKNTFDELKKIYKFLEIDIPNNILKKIVEDQSYENLPKEIKGKGRVIRSANPGNWNTNFSEEEKIVINEIMGKKLKQFGY